MLIFVWFVFRNSSNHEWIKKCIGPEYDDEKEYDFAILWLRILVIHFKQRCETQDADHFRQKYKESIYSLIQKNTPFGTDVTCIILDYIFYIQYENT